MTISRLARIFVRHRRWLLAGVAAWPLCAAAVPAQTQQEQFDQLPSAADPTRIEERIAPLAPLPRGSVPIIEDRDEEPPPATTGSVRFILSGVTVEGATVYGADSLGEIAAPFIGAEVSLAEIYEIAQSITVRYRNDGYILSRAIVPPQRIVDGRVTIRVIEGYVEDISIDGTVRGDEDLLAAYAMKIQDDRPLNARTLERYLLLMNDLPGVSARSIFVPSDTTQGASDLIIQMDHQVFAAGASLDNRGTRFIGPYQISAYGGFNSIAQLYERFRTRILLTPDREELLYIDSALSFPIGNEGTTLNGNLAFSRSKPANVSLPVDGRVATLALGVTHPLIRSRTENLILRGAFVARRAKTDSDGIELLEDQTRAIRIGATFDRTDQFGGVTILDAELSQGLDIFRSETADQFPSRSDGRTDFTKFVGEIGRLQRILPGLNVAASLRGQYAPAGLLSSEEFAIGGSRYGRGYDPAEISGDNGLAAKVELQYTPPVRIDGVDRLQAYVFYDVGKVWNYGDDDLIDPRLSDPSLASAGIGIRFQMLDVVQGDLEIAQPLTRRVASGSGKSTRVFFSVSVDY